MAHLEKAEPMVLFGGEKGWDCDGWTASDDRVRGGKSQSYLDCTEKTACFHGNLDIKTLGGAGFASQRTTSDDLGFDLHKYAGITLHLAKGDKKRYTFILKDQVLPKNTSDGREQASINYECDFELPPQAEPGESHDRTVFIPWESLNPTYRGRLQKDAKPFDTSSVKRISIMMRSYFGTQEGDFSLKIRSITAAPNAPPHGDVIASKHDSRSLEAGQGGSPPDSAGSYMHLGVGQYKVRVHKGIALATVVQTVFVALYFFAGRIWPGK